MSDDSLEVIVVKKSLEKKCEKVVSGTRSKTPRESTKETRVTKLHKRSSKITSRSSKSKTSDNEENTTDRAESPAKEVRELAERTRRGRSRVKQHLSTKEDEGEGDADEVEFRAMESRYGMDGTDSTSQETVERVVVTAMVHKDQIPDTPKSTLETFSSSPSSKETSPSDLPLPKIDTQDKTLGGKTEMTPLTEKGSSLVEKSSERVEEANDKREGKRSKYMYA